MTLYLDTSSLVKLYVDEPDSDVIADRVAQAAVVATSAVAYAEARATFGRRRRERLLSAQTCARAVHQFDLDWASFLVVEVTSVLARSAGALADRLGLRGVDAIHLASFQEILSRADEREVEFSTADKRLARAARRLR